MSAFKILSIDGGGIKGLYSASILNHFEAELQKKYGEGRHIVDSFDLICGTSTGALIALAIALRKPCQQIVDFYTQQGPVIFKKSRGLGATVRQLLWGGKFSDADLRRALDKMYGKSTMGDSEALLCIPVYDVTHGTYGVFKYDHPEGNLNRHNRVPVTEVALATSAAPTYFPMAEVASEDHTQFIDGGVWANNPALVGFTEAIRYFVGQDNAYDSIDMLSIASLNIGQGQPPGLKRNRAFIDWRNGLFDTSLIGQSEFTDIFLKSLARNTDYPLNYMRIPSANIDPHHVQYIGLDIAKTESINLMKQYAKDMYFRVQKDQNISNVFHSDKTYIIPRAEQPHQEDDASVPS